MKPISSIKVPKDVSEAIHDIASDTQHGFLETWLPDLVENGVRPVVDDEKYQGQVDTILKFRDQVLKTDLAAGKPSERLTGLKKQYVSTLLHAEAYQEKTEKVKDIFKVALAASAGGFFLSRFAPAFLQFAEAIGDDLANWFAQIVTQKEAGLSKKELIKSQALPFAALVGVERLTDGMDAALHDPSSCKPGLGAEYGFASSLVSLAAIPPTIFALAKHYKELVKEGKAKAPEFTGPWKKIRGELHALKEGAKQCWKHPAAAGIVYGSLGAVLAGALLGPLVAPFSDGTLLQNPAFLAFIGTGPSFGALINTSVHRHMWNSRLEKIMGQIKQETAAAGSSAPDSEAA